MQATVNDATFGKVVSEEQMNLVSLPYRAMTLKNLVVVLSIANVTTAVVLLLTYNTAPTYVTPEAFLIPLYIVHGSFFLQITLRYFARIPVASWITFIFPVLAEIAMILVLWDVLLSVYIK